MRQSGRLEPRIVTLGVDENVRTLAAHFSDDGLTSSGDLDIGEVRHIARARMRALPWLVRVVLADPAGVIAGNALDRY